MVAIWGGGRRGGCIGVAKEPLSIVSGKGDAKRGGGV